MTIIFNYDIFWLGWNWIDVCGEIDEGLANRVCIQITNLSKLGEPIVLFIDSEGGCTSALQRIVNTIIDCGVLVYACVIGKASSAAFDLILFCQRRYALKGTFFMFHLAILTDQFAQAISSSFGEPAFAPEEEFDTEVFIILAKMLNKTVDEIRQMAREEKTWTAMQALHAGIIDFIID